VRSQLFFCSIGAQFPPAPPPFTAATSLVWMSRNVSNIESLLTHTRTAAYTLREISDDQPIVPYLKVIGGVSILILDTVQVTTSFLLPLFVQRARKNVRANKQQCFRMIERINDIVAAIINTSGDWGTEPSPAMFRNLSSFAEYAAPHLPMHDSRLRDRTLQKVHTFIRNQVHMNMVQRIAHHLENEAQLNECNAALQHALDVFGVSKVTKIAEQFSTTIF
jgi:hypothetical protein